MHLGSTPSSGTYKMKLREVVFAIFYEFFIIRNRSSYSFELIGFVA